MLQADIFRDFLEHIKSLSPVQHTQVVVQLLQHLILFNNSALYSVKCNQKNKYVADILEQLLVTCSHLDFEVVNVQDLLVILTSTSQLLCYANGYKERNILNNYLQPDTDDVSLTQDVTTVHHPNEIVRKQHRVLQAWLNGTDCDYLRCDDIMAQQLRLAFGTNVKRRKLNMHFSQNLVDKCGSVVMMIAGSSSFVCQLDELLPALYLEQVETALTHNAFHIWMAMLLADNMQCLNENLFYESQYTSLHHVLSQSFTQGISKGIARLEYIRFCLSRRQDIMEDEETVSGKI